MRSAALVSAVFALGAIAQPAHEKRDIVTDFQVVVETVYVTEDVVATAVPKKHHHHHHHHHHNTVVSVAAVSVPASPPSSVAASSTSVAAPATSAAAPAPPPAPSAPASGSPEQLYIEAVMTSHNIHRANHSAADLTWSDRLAWIAMQEANMCYFNHTNGYGGGYGQNIAAGTPGNNVSEIITGQLYNGEMPLYADNYGQPNVPSDLFVHVGHFTQIVWKATTQVGCYTADCTAQGLGNVPSDCAPYYTVCNYYPAGNMGGEYGEMVGEPLGRPTVNWAYGGDSGATWVGK